MSERQDIDRLFQEKFKDFEAAPSDKIWANIQRQMNKEEEEEGKKEPVLLPLWLKVCGVAAVFLIGFSVGNSYLFNPKNKSIDTTDGVASETKSKTETINSTTNSSVLENQLNSQNNNSLVNSEESNNTIVSKKQLNEITASEKTTSSENNIKNSWKGTNLNNPSSQQATASVERKKAVQSSANLKENNTINTTNSVTSVSEKTTITNTGNPSILNNATAEEKIAAANNNGIANTNSDAKNTSELVKENSADLLYQNNKSKVAFEVGKERYSNLSDRGIQAKNPNKSNPVFANNQSAVIVKDEKLLKKSTLPKTLGITTVDSSQLANGKENPLDKLLKEKEEKNKKEDSKATTNSKWVVSSKATPVFMGASGSNSTLDSQFDNNSRNYKTTFSYGMGVSYAVTDKLSVRTGINSVNLEYNTNDILYYESKNMQTLQNVRRNETAGMIQVEDKDSRKLALSEGNIVTQKSSGALSQRMGYIEVPTELSYKLLNKKFGIEVIGGISTLFLTQNEVSIVSDRQEMKIGEASNLNDIHLSSNIGLGFCYKFNKSLEANMEPMFKYQINTFRNNSGDFKPYYMGVFTGISYRF